MNIWEAISGWFGKKAFSFGLSSTMKMARDNTHPEKYKARDAIEANKEVSALRGNNDIVSSIGKVIESGAVGTGFTLQYKSQDEELNNSVESFLEYWSEHGNCDITGRFFRNDMERHMAVEAGVMGGFIVRHHWDKRHETLYAPEILPTSSIDRTKNDFSQGLYFGVQTNKLGKITHIHIYDGAERTSSTKVRMKNLILFLDIWNDPLQYTSITPLAPMLNTLDKMASYTEAEVKGAEKRANKSIIVATEAYAIILRAQEEMVLKAESERGKELAREEYLKLLSAFSANGLHEGATPIMPGDNTQVWDLKQSGDTIYADISLNSKQILSRAIGYSASAIAGIPESSYNQALKSSQADEIRHAIIAQKIIEIVCKPIYRNAIEAGFLLGFYDLKDFYAKKRVYGSYLKIGRKKLGHIDPLKQHLADLAAKSGGINSMIDVIASGGKDYMDVIKDEVRYEIARKKAFEDQGLKYIQSGTNDIALAEAKEEAKNNNGD